MKQLLFVLVALILVLSGCAAQAPAARQSASPAEAPAPAQTEAQTSETGGAAAKASAQQLLDARMIVYNGNMTLIVKDTDATAREVETLAKSLEGYVANANSFRDQDGIMIYNITMRVPAAQFDAARAALRGLAVRVDNESVNTDDVTDQYYDLDARLKTLRATEQQLLDLLKETRERGGKVEDIMSIYRELVSVQSEIESLQGQLNRLDKIVALSTLTLNIQPDSLATPLSTAWRPLETLKNSFGALISVLRGLVDLFIYLIVVILPVLLILAIPVVVVVLVIRWLVHRLRKSAPEQPDAPDKGQKQ